MLIAVSEGMLEGIEAAVPRRQRHCPEGVGATSVRLRANKRRARGRRGEADAKGGKSRETGYAGNYPLP